jgi:hypothetical protein
MAIYGFVKSEGMIMSVVGDPNNFTSDIPPSARAMFEAFSNDPRRDGWAQDELRFNEFQRGWLAATEYLSSLVDESTSEGSAE